MIDLTGINIILTRPSAQGEPWANRLRELGASVHSVPMLAIVPIVDSNVQEFVHAEDPHVRAIKNCILDLDLYHKVIFVSQNAVETGFEWIDNYWPQLPTRVAFLAVGESTAKMLQSYGATVTDMVQTQTGAMTSEALLESPALQQVAGEKILIMRGRGGRNHLGDALVMRGAKVDYCELYERQLPLEAAYELESALSDSGRLDEYRNEAIQIKAYTLLVVQSGEALQNLVTTLQQIFLDHTQYRSLALLVPSVRVGNEANHLGFQQVYVAANATESVMQQHIKEIRDRWVHA